MLFADVSARHVGGIVRDQSINALRQQWKERHKMVPAAETNRDVAPVTFRRCQLGTRVCHGFRLRLCQRIFGWFRTLPRADLQAGLLVVSWQSFFLDEDPSCIGRRQLGRASSEQRSDAWSSGSGLSRDIRYAHVASCSLSPFLVTLVEVEPVARSPTAGNVHRFKQSLGASGCPRIYSIFEWVAEIDIRFALDLGVRRIDNTDLPLPIVDGSVLLGPLDTVSRCRRGDFHENIGRRQRRQQPLHATLSGDGRLHLQRSSDFINSCNECGM